MTKEQKLWAIKSKLKSMVKNSGISSSFIKYMNKIHSLGDETKDLFEDIQDYVISTKIAEYIYYFAIHIEGANIEKLEDAIITLKSPYYILCFAQFVKGANIKKLEDAIIATQNAEYIHHFARSGIEGVNTYKLLLIWRELRAKEKNKNKDKDIMFIYEN